MSYSSTVLADGAVGFWPLSESSTATGAIDQAGNQNGVYQNTTGIALGQTGIPGGAGATAALFSRPNNGFMTAAAHTAQQVGDTFTLEVWFKMTGGAPIASDFLSFTCGGGGSPTRVPNMVINSAAQVQIGADRVVGIGNSAGSIPDTTNFHHLVWTKATTTNHIYIDGVASDGTYTNTNCVSATSGWNFFSDSGVFFTTGVAAMLALYPTALSSTKVANHYALGSVSPSTQANFGGVAGLLMMLREGS